MLLSRLGRQDEAEDDASLRPGQLWDTNDLAALAYRARPYPGRITHFVPVKEYARHQGALLGWEGLAEGGVDLHKMPVYPDGMLVEPFVEKTAAVLTACIDEALAGQRISVS